MFFLILLTYHW